MIRIEHISFRTPAMSPPDSVQPGSNPSGKEKSSFWDFGDGRAADANEVYNVAIYLVEEGGRREVLLVNKNSGIRHVVPYEQVAWYREQGEVKRALEAKAQAKADAVAPPAETTPSTPAAKRGKAPPTT